MEIVAADIGGTHARFAIAEVADGAVLALGAPFTMRTAEHASLETAWADYRARAGRPLPRAVAIALAAPVAGPVLKLTNNPWVIHPGRLTGALHVDEIAIFNDFEAVAHAAALLGEEHFRPICGPDRPLAASPVVSVVGPGTGLGVAQLLRLGGMHHVIPTEGGHGDFAPLDSFEDRLLVALRDRHRRVSVERVVAGMGLVAIHALLAEIEGRPVPPRDERALWTAALEQSDPLAVAALDRWCLSLGAVAGDLALAHGAQAVAIAGGLGLRLADQLPRSGFRDRFIAKGRFERLMNDMPVKLITHPQPGLFGAAAAFASRRR